MMAGMTDDDGGWQGDLVVMAIRGEGKATVAAGGKNRENGEKKRLLAYCGRRSNDG